MNKRNELRLRHFAEDPRFAYLTDKDKYLFSNEKPTYQFNVIGTGTIGQEHMFLTTLEGRAGIHGIYDTNSSSVENAKREYARYSDKQLVIYDSLEQACNAPEVDGLIICTPNYTHIDVARVAAKSAKHILLEKPMATTIQDAYEITQIAGRHKSIFQVGLQYRYKSIYVEAIHEALERKSIGDIKTISMLEHRPPFLDKVGQWNKFSKYSGGSLVEKCCHYFDLMNFFAQSRPSIVYAVGNMAVNFTNFNYENEPSDIVDNAFVNIIYENDVLAGFNLNMFCPNFYEELVLCGNEGRLKAHEEFDFFHKTESDSLIEIQHGENRAARTIIPNYASFIEKSGHHGSTFYEHQAFVDNIEGKKTRSADVQQGFWSVVVGVAAEDSMRKKSPVKIKELIQNSGINMD